ncbi:hypothetical protein NPIL_276531 [Nephila pilipes]|uniref:Uncharacterized protein n=1 Tax=Nephila pilipes TaxID=299642 RepID=A0A8X6UKK9_NEPPI|nr:hypothetical protein NPIL_276531 [Nephila pilipes]
MLFLASSWGKERGSLPSISRIIEDIKLPTCMSEDDCRRVSLNCPSRRKPSLYDLSEVKEPTCLAVRRNHYCLAVRKTTTCLAVRYSCN